MSIYYPGCNSTINDPVCSDCPDKELGGVRSFWLQKNSFAFTDITNPAEWRNAICNKDIYVFPYSNGSLSAAPQESPGFGNVAVDVDSYEFTVAVKEPNYLSNVGFWNTIKKSHNFLLGIRTETQVLLSDVPVLIEPMAPIADDQKSKIAWNVTFKFIQENWPVNYNMPIGTFTRCISC